MRARTFVFALVLGATSAAQAQQAGDTSAMAVSPFPTIVPAVYLDADVVGPTNRATVVLAQLRSVCAEVTDHPRAWALNRHNARRCSAGKAAFGEGYVQYRARLEATAG